MDPEVTEDRTEERGGQEHHHHHAPECSAGLHTGGGGGEGEYIRLLFKVVLCSGKYYWYCKYTFKANVLKTKLIRTLTFTHLHRQYRDTDIVQPSQSSYQLNSSHFLHLSIKLTNPPHNTIVTGRVQTIT